MSLAAGTRFGPYEIVMPLGAGGMGEVYHGRDTRLGRDVAIKVLPPHLSQSPEFRARFEREARAISSLNHPHICVLYDVGREGEVDYLVMEHLDGETLAARLERGPLPIEPLLKAGIEIADALDKAHRQGLVHRDLKPGNVMLTKSGAKLLDFGLARSVVGQGGPAGLTQPITMSRPLTAEGSIVGTFQYMAPEQLEGQEADARTDLFALGATLYEMATGRRAFEGKSQASLIAAILERDPPAISTVAPLAPPALDRLVRACLAKDPDQRVQMAHDVKLQLQWIAEGGSAAGVPAPVAARRRSREAFAWAAAATAGVAALGLGAGFVLLRPPPPKVTRFMVEAPPGAPSMLWPRLSPDGTQLAFLATDSTGTPRIWIRPLDALTAHPLAGTENPGRPFWSPDGRFLAYISDGKLKKVPVAGGPVVTISDAPGGADGSWGTRGLILFDGSTSDSIRSVPAAGGSVRAASFLHRGRNDASHAWPHFLPDGRHFLFLAYPPGASEGSIMAGAVGSPTAKEIGRTEGRVEYAAPGYLVYPREGTLMAQPFDLRALRITGDPIPVGENVTVGQASGHFSTSGDGVLAYRAEETEEKSQLVWVDRAGRRLGDAGPPAQYRDLAISPDGSRVAVSIAEAHGGSQDIWIRHLARGVTTRLTFTKANDVWPIWSPDGQRVAFSSDRSGEYRVFVKAASGGEGEDSLQHVPGGPEGPTDWSRDGRLVATTQRSASWDMWVESASGKDPPRSFLQSPFNDRSMMFSRDGRWVAYSSSESGQQEVYVQTFPGPGGKWQVSTNGGFRPYWRADGKELFYRTNDGVIMAAPVSLGATFESGTPVALFKTALVDLDVASSRWAPTADGKRFLLNVPAGGESSAQFAVVTHWTSELKKR